MAKRLIEMPSEKWDPNKRIPYKDNLDHTEKRKQQFQKYIEGKTNLYNPDITEKDEPEDAIRIFTKQKITEETAKQKPVLREHNGSGKNWESIQTAPARTATQVKPEPEPGHIAKWMTPRRKQ